MNRIISVTTAALLTSALPASAQHDWGPWRMHEWLGWGWGGMWLGPLLMIGGLALLAALIVAVVRWLGGGGVTGARSARTAREILDERYARGEIDHEEYQRKRHDIDVR